MKMGVQLFSGAIQEMQDLRYREPFLPPQTTSLPLDRRERVGLVLACVWDNFGTAQVADVSGGNVSVLDRATVS